MHPPILADVDGDGRPDVVASSDMTATGQLVLNGYRFDANPVTNFPKITHSPASWITSSAAVGDLDGDGLNEMVWVDGDGNLYLWDLPAATGGPKPWPMWRHDELHTGAN
jgi:hypothetical protein